MRRIEVISASAGTGKTYALCDLLLAAVGDGSARPDAVLATTFTKKAAAELEERVRRKLLAAGRAEEAQRLGASRIGTVNAVCSQLVMDFAFELGLSPNLRVLDEELASLALRQALSKVVDQSTQDELGELSTRLERFDWQKAVHDMIDQARSNRLEPDDLRSAAARSLASFVELLGSAHPDASVLDRELYEALDDFVQRAPALNNGRLKGTDRAIEKARPLRDRLRAGRPLTWYEWTQLTRLKGAKNVGELTDRLNEAAAHHDRHPGLRNDCLRAIELVHELAALAYGSYQTYKRTWGVVDFADQELYALQLLERADVRERLAGEIDLVLVDEFQDTSPIQLAIFLRLADIAKRSVWVGDPKQAIFGFRGTDPALLDTVLASLGREAHDRVLDTQYRSRPELVELTSALFSRAFAMHGVEPSHVVVDPYLTRAKEPPGLGPVLEVWRLKSGNNAHDAAALAACVADLLASGEVNVRADVAEQATRPARPGDVAVLCRYNATCAQVAHALEDLGLPAVLPRQGLFATPEGVVALAALQRFADPRDQLALAKLSRFLVTPDDPDAWLAQLLSEPRAAAFAGHPAVARITAAREALTTAGAVSALDASLEAVGLRELCLRWGDSRQRLANVDRVRAHAVGYAAHCESTGSGCTPAGLATHLQVLAAAERDAQAVPRSQEAVNVLTWHAAKGLEWPIVVLSPHRERADGTLGVYLVDDRAEIDLRAPLAQRWVRFWPDPYAAGPQRGRFSANADAPFRQRLEAQPDTQTARSRSTRQSLRLLYVGWTRARDRLVLSSRPQKLTSDVLSVLADERGPLLDVPSARASWAGVVVDVLHREGGLRASVERSARPGSGLTPSGARAHPPAHLSPSALQRWAPAGTPIRLGELLRVAGRPDMTALGEAMHGFLAVDLGGLDLDEREDVASSLLARWGVAAALSVADLLVAADRLRAWLDRSWPGASVHCEWPVEEQLPGGTVVGGFADLALETPAGFVVIDHKSFIGGVRAAREAAAERAGQVAAYASAVARATGTRRLACYVHYPLSGLVVELRPGQLELAL